MYESRMTLTSPGEPRRALSTVTRNGLVSGCYPLDVHYKKSPEMAVLTQIKKAAKLS